MIKMLQKLAKLQASVSELIARQKLNDARARILTTHGLHHAREARKVRLAQELKEKKHGTN
jgi:hypothetical protein